VVPPKRILDVKNVNTDVLFNTEISNILYTDMRPLYGISTVQGKLCRKILNRYQDLCKLDPRLRNEELPPISDMSEDEIDLGEPVRSFRSLFTTERRSTVVSQMNYESSEISSELPLSSHLASSTILDLNPEDRRRKRPPPMSLIFSENLEFDRADISPSSPRPMIRITSPSPARQDHDNSPTVFLTPPPPTPSPPRRRRGRPAAQPSLPIAMASSPPKRKRGRPAKTKSPVGQPLKKARGRPRKEC
jgi:hypothetical protein